jgi:hypothetical protein
VPASFNAISFFRSFSFVFTNNALLEDSVKSLISPPPKGEASHKRGRNREGGVGSSQLVASEATDRNTESLVSNVQSDIRFAPDMPKSLSARIATRCAFVGLDDARFFEAANGVILHIEPLGLEIGAFRDVDSTKAWFDWMNPVADDP